MPSYAANYAKRFETNLKAIKGDGRDFIGMSPPKSDNPDEKWVVTGTTRVSSSNPKSGHTWSTVPTWSKIKTNTAAPPAAQDDKRDSTQQASAPPPAAASQDLTNRRSAYERAQEYQTQTAAVPRTPPPADPMSKDFYSGLNSYGRALIDDYKQDLVTQARRSELAVAENAFFGNRTLQQIDPKKMNVSKADTWQDTVARLKELRGLIT